MKYMFVLQWPGSSIRDYDSMIEKERTLTSTLSKRHKVDGHDIGSDEANIFIATGDPERLCEEVKSLMSPAGLSGCRMAYRKMGDYPNPSGRIADRYPEPVSDADRGDCIPQGGGSDYGAT
ncbi:MAG TPA: hypothetical protein VKW08_15000 [Xanthobacteraceae bacterium]|nr:hypothetical protein [Xanthobacteraceae bacterium]